MMIRSYFGVNITALPEESKIFKLVPIEATGNVDSLTSNYDNFLTCGTIMTFVSDSHVFVIRDWDE